MADPIVQALLRKDMPQVWSFLEGPALPDDVWDEAIEKVVVQGTRLHELPPGLFPPHKVVSDPGLPPPQKAQKVARALGLYPPQKVAEVLIPRNLQRAIFGRVRSFRAVTAIFAHLVSLIEMLQSFPSAADDLCWALQNLLSTRPTFKEASDLLLSSLPTGPSLDQFMLFVMSSTFCEPLLEMVLYHTALEHLEHYKTKKRQVARHLEETPAAMERPCWTAALHAGFVVWADVADDKAVQPSSYSFHRLLETSTLSKRLANRALYDAAQSGQVDKMVTLLQDGRTDPNFALRGAADTYFRHVDIIRQLLLHKRGSLAPLQDDPGQYLVAHAHLPDDILAEIFSTLLTPEALVFCAEHYIGVRKAHEFRVLMGSLPLERKREVMQQVWEKHYQRYPRLLTGAGREEILDAFLGQFSVDELRALDFADKNYYGYDYVGRHDDQDTIRRAVERILREWSPIREAWVTAVMQGLRKKTQTRHRF